MICDSNNKTNFPRKLLLTDKHVLSIFKTSENSFWVNIKLSKTLISKIIQLKRFLSKLFGPLIKTKTILIP